jgi:hypothetical protein
MPTLCSAAPGKCISNIKKNRKAEDINPDKPEPKNGVLGVNRF